MLSTGDNEELCYCLKAWQDLPESVQGGTYPSKEDALKVLMPVTWKVDALKQAYRQEEPTDDSIDVEFEMLFVTKRCIVSIALH